MAGALGVIVALIADALPLHGAPSRSAALMLAATFGRFVDGLVTPLLYRRACDSFPEAAKQTVTRAQGACSIAATALASWGVLWIVHSGLMH